MDQPTDRDRFVAGAIARMQAQYATAVPAPSLGRPLIYAEHIELIAHIMTEHQENEERHVTT